MLIVAANKDQNMLEEYSNYIHHKYKLHLARINSITNYSTSEYEYCIELIKNAKIRASITAIIPPSLDYITINPNKD